MVILSIMLFVQLLISNRSVSKVKLVALQDIMIINKNITLHMCHCIAIVIVIIVTLYFKINNLYKVCKGILYENAC